MRIVIVTQDGVVTGLIHDGDKTSDVLIKNGDDLYRCAKEVEYNPDFVWKQFKTFVEKDCAIEGTLDDICCHRVSYYFKGSRKITPELAEMLDEHAEQRALEMIKTGCRSGELYFQDQLENEYSGWWRIV